MVWIGALIFVSVFFSLVGIAFYLYRTHQAGLQSGFNLIQNSFESLQRNLLVQQTEFERSHETRAGSLRKEIQQELSLNRGELQKALSFTTQTLDQKVTQMDSRVELRLKEMSQGVQTKLEQNIKEGFRHFEKVQEHLKLAEIQLSNLNNVGQSIQDLNNLLKLPHLRGNFGEAILENLLSDILPREAFELQYQIVPSSTERVDAVVKYPSTVLPIDSKFPRERVFPLFETSEPAQLEIARKSLAEAIKTLAKQIREKYIHPEHGTTDLALLFVPSETLYFEVLRDARLCEYLGKLRVFAVSPNTLAVTLHAVASARSYYEMAKGIEKTLSELKKAEQHYDNFEKRFEEIGSSLIKAQSAFHTAATHLSRYSGSLTRVEGSFDKESKKKSAPEMISSQKELPQPSAEA